MKVQFQKVMILLLFFGILSHCSSSNINNHENKGDLPGFKVAGADLLDRCGEKVILRGVNRMTIWMDKDGVPSFFEIAKTGANVIRIVWLNDGTASILDKAISNCTAQKMIPMIENHSATGDFSKLQSVIDYWTKPEVLYVIKKHEKDLLLNIANEVGDHNVDETSFRMAYKKAITQLRDAGIKTPLVIDSSSWGQNIDILQANWKELQSHDPLHNLLFSIHMWWLDKSKEYITKELEESVKAEMPLIIGEFANKGYECRCCIEYLHIIAEAERLGIGWLSWSWGPGNRDCADMDMTSEATFESLKGWGLEVAVTDKNSIKNTSTRPYSMINGRCKQQ